ncbi:hypothetical protein [uncultured Winogradskyella sp.]|uniref:hypothetical protein n=1 Tax=uncultured Winogradskyella sp. TaxID=395353 RepID=UPI00262538A2|nr:hypothetical protein [uncultured Winogradskyella sp.]
MKKGIISFNIKLAILSLLIFGFTNCISNTEVISEDSSNSKDLALEDPNIKDTNTKSIPDLYYGVDARFAAVKKEDVHSATTIYDFLNDGEKAQIEYINSVDVIIVKDNQLSQIRARGTSAKLTDAQKEILKATDYFSHFTIRTEFKSKNKETGKLEERFFGPHITVVPEKQATYYEGKDALIEYLKVNSKESMKVIKGDDLGAIKLSFVISKEGSVKDVKHDAMTTGYPSIDKKFIQLLENIPGKWIPAENVKGEKIDQELVFTFGPRDGC